MSGNNLNFPPISAVHKIIVRYIFSTFSVKFLVQFFISIIFSTLLVFLFLRFFIKNSLSSWCVYLFGQYLMCAEILRFIKMSRPTLYFYYQLSLPAVNKHKLLLQISRREAFQNNLLSLADLILKLST